tara:strand:+ start:459 stop:650 length:192 start_codon:yes stop_codon:yes gene_type:complete
MKGKSMIWNVQLKLERPDDFKEEDESWFDEDHMKTEFTVWLEDLDYTVTDVKIEKCSKKKLKK